MGDRGSERGPAAALAQQVLPVLDDLLGDGWVVDDDEGEQDESSAGGSRRGGSGLPDECLPADFPEAAVTAGAEVAFVRPDVAGVYAMATVFDRGASASAAWSVLLRDDFVRCFMASVGAEVHPLADAQLLGPVLRPATRPSEGAARVGAQVAVFSRADPRSVVPIEVRVAVVGAGVAVVVVWAVDRGGPDAERCWDHLVERVAARCEGTIE
jgi:hypothetical protein